MCLLYQLFAQDQFSQIRCSSCKIKEGCLEEVKAHYQSAMEERRGAVLETFANEGMLIRLLAKLHLLAKIALFGIFFIKFFNRMSTYALKILQKTCTKSTNFFKQSRFCKKSIECGFIKEENGSHYLILFLRVYDMDKAREAYRKFTLEEDLLHRAFGRKCFEHHEVLSPIYHLEAADFSNLIMTTRS